MSLSRRNFNAEMFECSVRGQCLWRQSPLYIKQKKHRVGIDCAMIEIVDRLLACSKCEFLEKREIKSNVVTYRSYFPCEVQREVVLYCGNGLLWRNCMSFPIGLESFEIPPGKGRPSDLRVRNMNDFVGHTFSHRP